LRSGGLEVLGHTGLATAPSTCDGVGRQQDPAVAAQQERHLPGAVAGVAMISASEIAWHCPPGSR